MLGDFAGGLAAGGWGEHVGGAGLVMRGPMLERA